MSEQSKTACATETDAPDAACTPDLCPLCGDTVLVREHQLQTRREAFVGTLLFLCGAIPGIVYGTVITLFPYCSKCRRRIYRAGPSLAQTPRQKRNDNEDV